MRTDDAAGGAIPQDMIRGEDLAGDAVSVPSSQGRAMRLHLLY